MLNLRFRKQTYKDHNYYDERTCYVAEGHVITRRTLTRGAWRMTQYYSFACTCGWRGKSSGMDNYPARKHATDVTL